MKLSFIRFFLCCVLIFATQALAQEPALDLQDSLAEDSLRIDSLHVDSLSKISLTADIDANNVVDTNKVEHIDAGIKNVGTFTDEDVRDISNFLGDDNRPVGAFTELAYAGPSIMHVKLFGIRDDIFPFGKGRLFGGSSARFDIDFDRGIVSDELLLLTVLGVGTKLLFDLSFEIFFYVMSGDSYFALSKNGWVGLFESHHVVDYFFGNLGTSRGWEFGWSQAAGVRLALIRYTYFDVGYHVQISNQRKLHGMFLQFGTNFWTFGS